MSAPLSQAEKQTLKDFRGDEPAQVVVVQVSVVQPEPQVVYVRPEVADAAEPPAYDAVIGGDAHHA